MRNMRIKYTYEGLKSKLKSLAIYYLKFHYCLVIAQENMILRGLYTSQYLCLIFHNISFPIRERLFSFWEKEKSFCCYFNGTICVEEITMFTGSQCNCSEMFCLTSATSLVKEVCVYVYVTQVSVSRILVNRYYILIYHQLKY